MLRISILLTGCIHPNTKEGLAISDANVRKKQYCNAIRWYLTNTPYNIVFCENSGTDISSDVGLEGGKNRISHLYEQALENRLW